MTALSAAPIFTSVVATGRDVISSQDLSSSTTFSERVFRDAAQVAFDLTGIVKQSGMTTVALTTIGRGCLLVTSLHQYRNQPEELLCSLVLFLDSLKEMAISIFRASAVKSPSKHTTIAFALRLLMSLINVERDFFDPLSESEVCEDVSEIASDLTDVFYGRSVFMYLGTFGRTIALASNFFPHHACHPEQVLCQSIMLTISLNRLMDKVQSE